MTVLRLSNLRVSVRGHTLVAVDDLQLVAGECVAIVGESGAGKSMLARALLGLAPAGVRVEADRLRIDGVELSAAGEREWRAARGRSIALVPQEALAALDPLRRAGAEVAEPMSIHGTVPSDRRAKRVQTLLADVAMPDPVDAARRYPDELSGGLRQRVLIASALAGEPAVIVADEPTTALDATVQRRVLALIRGLADAGRAVLIISHDIAAMAGVADRMVVMRDGVVVETGETQTLLAAPRAAYTRALIDAARRREPTPRSRTGDVVLAAHGLTRRFTASHAAVSDVSVQLRRGRVLGIVGESGSGKTTLVRMLLGAEQPDGGTVTLHGEPWAPLPERRRRARRTRIQLVGQQPRAAFEPSWSIGRSLGEALGAVGVPRGQRNDATAALLARVELHPALATRRPHQLSGGQLQRAAIARALAVRPEVLLLDEPLSALDVSVGARILTLLARLRDEEDMAIAFISHDLRVVGELSDDLVVMRAGRIVERGDAQAVMGAPQHEFTRELLDAAVLLP